ncbi:hypothetical protein A6A08_16255 [Nocardiopsis sp. TSRI0078]|nr:hypothetical protein A6A08_16255 [Nocardiopsis sp. TSRI0078]
MVYREDDHYVFCCVEAGIASFGETREEAEAMTINPLELNYMDQPVPLPVDEPAMSAVEVNVDCG